MVLEVDGVVLAACGQAFAVELVGAVGGEDGGEEVVVGEGFPEGREVEAEAVVGDYVLTEDEGSDFRPGFGEVWGGGGVRGADAVDVGESIPIKISGRLD